jgi:AcrR family transcriptional regulator
MPKPEAPYHRDNLEQLLLEKAAEIVAASGVEALSLRELGRCANVSRSAPYHYFPDKGALLAKVGEQGFARLGARIAHEAETSADPLERLRRGLHGYVHFALEEPHFFRLMFANVLERRLPGAESQAGPLMFSGNAARQTFSLLLDGILELQAQSRLRANDPLLWMNVFWAYAHGVAVLALDANLKGCDATQVLDAGLDALIASAADEA